MRARQLITLSNRWPRGYINIGTSYLPTFTAKRTSGQRTRVLCIGQSNMRGVGSGTGALLNVGCEQSAIPKLLADYCNDRGVAAAHNGTFAGNFGTGGSDSRVTLNAGWAASPANTSIGGSSYRNSTNTNNWTFQPGSAYDRLVFGYNRVSGFDTAEVDNGGAALATINANGASAQLASSAISAASSSNAINVKRTAVGTSFDVVWVEAYTDASPKIEFMNAGYSGASFITQLDLTTQPWSPANSIAAYAPDLTIIMNGAQDQIDGATETDFKTAVQVDIDKALISGDVILVSSTPYSAAVTPTGETGRANEARWMKDLARTNRTPFVDLQVLLPDYTTANAMGWMGNTAHMNATGYGVAAPLIGRALAI